MLIIKRTLLPAWLLLAAMTISGCAYYDALERATKEDIRTKEELRVAREKSEKMRGIAGEQKKRLRELKKQISVINRKLDELEQRKKEEEDKVNKLYAEKKQLKKSREKLIKKREEELLRVKKEFEPEIKRLTTETARKEKELLKLKEENAE